MRWLWLANSATGSTCAAARAKASMHAMKSRARSGASRASPGRRYQRHAIPSRATTQAAKTNPFVARVRGPNNPGRCQPQCGHHPDAHGSQHHGPGERE